MFQEERLVSIRAPCLREFFSPKSFRMNPDLGSGRSISYEAHFKRALIQMEPCRKMADSPVPREKPVISPGKASASGQTLPRIYKKNISRDTKFAVGRELTKSNLFSVQALQRGNPQTVTYETGQSQNKLGSEIWAGVFRSRDFHEEP